MLVIGFPCTIATCACCTSNARCFMSRYCWIVFHRKRVKNGRIKKSLVGGRKEKMVCNSLYKCLIELGFKGITGESAKMWGLYSDTNGLNIITKRQYTTGLHK